VFLSGMPQDGFVSGQQGPAREKKAMKKTLMTIAFAAASLPMFAAHQATPAVPPVNQPAKTEAKPVVKSKKVKKASKKSTEKKATPAATPAPAVKK
jgi:hypothetical protein